MNDSQFIHWLQGYLDGISYKGVDYDSALVKLIKTKLSELEFPKTPYAISFNNKGTGGNDTTNVTYDFTKAKTILKG